jgi:hypothetical protein
MSSTPSFIRDFTKRNLLNDLVEMFPKLGKSLLIPRSDGTFTFGNVLQSNIFKNYYAQWIEIYQSWFIPTIFIDSQNGAMFKYVDINDLSLSNFSWEEIHQIRKALEEGIYMQDMTKVSPNFHPINTWPNFKKKFTRKNNSPISPIKPDEFLNMPPLTL